MSRLLKIAQAFNRTYGININGTIDCNITMLINIYFHFTNRILLVCQVNHKMRLSRVYLMFHFRLRWRSFMPQFELVQQQGEPQKLNQDLDTRRPKNLERVQALNLKNYNGTNILPHSQSSFNSRP